MDSVSDWKVEGQLYVVHFGKIYALKGKTVESVKAEIRRLRIAHLRRMIQRAEYIIAGLCISDRRGKKRLLWFIESCECEIARLRGEG